MKAVYNVDYTAIVGAIDDDGNFVKEYRESQLETLTEEQKARGREVTTANRRRDTANRLSRQIVRATAYIEAIGIGQVEWLRLNPEAIKAQLTLYNNMYANAKGKDDQMSKAIVAAHEAAQANTAKATIVVNEMRKQLAALIETDIDAAEAALNKVERFQPQSLADIENFTMEA